MLWNLEENVKNRKREHLVLLSPLLLQPPSKAPSPLAYRPAMSLLYPLPFLCTSTIQTLSIGRAPLPFSPSAASNPRQRRARRYRRNQSSRDLALASPGLSSPGGSNQLLTPSVASPPLSNYHLLQGILSSRRLLHRCLTRHVKWQGQEMKPNELPRNIKSWRQERCNI